jgi:hypothetical protein
MDRLDAAALSAMYVETLGLRMRCSGPSDATPTAGRTRIGSRRCGSVRPSGDGRQGGEPVPAGGKRRGPGPGRVDSQPAAACLVGEAAGR